MTDTKYAIKRGSEYFYWVEFDVHRWTSARDYAVLYSDKESADSIASRYDGSVVKVTITFEE